MDSITQKISLDLIDGPRIAMRTDVRNDDLETLKADMARVGLIEPIVVRPVGARFEIIAGHRRTTAARELGWALIEAKVVNASDDEAFQMRVIENISRHDVDPVDEAIFIAQVMQQSNKDIDQMADMLHRTHEWVETRLEVFDMPEYLQEHLKYKRITLGAALELARIESETDRRYYANYAAQNGVSVSTAKRWRIDLNARPPMTEEERANFAAATVEPQYVAKFVKCFITGEEVELTKAESVWIKPGLRPLWEGGQV